MLKAEGRTIVAITHDDRYFYGGSDYQAGVWAGCVVRACSAQRRDFAEISLPVGKVISAGTYS